MRHLVRETGADPAATDSSRVLRLPGFMNHKYSKPFLVRVETRAIETYRPEHFPKIPAAEPGGRRVAGEVPHQAQPGLSQSERDWAYAKRALARGELSGKVIDAIAQYRVDQKSDAHAYAERTVHKAAQALEVERQLARTDPDR